MAYFSKQKDDIEHLHPGDIIFVGRAFYKHYGVYAGKDRVIHYSSSDGDFGIDACVRETSLGLTLKLELVYYTSNTIF